MKSIWRSCQGLSLLETILALSLSALFLVPLLMGFNLAIGNLNEDTNQRELFQHATTAMNRITSELKYAVAFGDRSNPYVLEFYTRTLLDDDWETEKIKYWLKTDGSGSYGIMRKVDDGPEQVIAGSPTSNIIDATAEGGLLAIYYKVEDPSIIQLADTDPDNWIEMVRVRIKVSSIKDPNQFVYLHSRVQIRNKQSD